MASIAAAACAGGASDLSSKHSYHPSFFKEAAGVSLYVPTVPSLADKEKLEAIDFTLLQHAYRTVDESALLLLKETRRCFPKVSVRQLVALTPARLIHHEILAQLQASIKLDHHPDDATTFHTVVEKLATIVEKDDKSTLTTQCHELYTSTTGALEALYDAMVAKSSDLASLPLYNEALQSTFDLLQTQADFSDKSDTYKQVFIQRWIAPLYHQQALINIESYVRAHIETLIEGDELKILDYHPADKSLAIFTTGGVASGKGSSLRQLAELLEKYHSPPIHWDELVHHNADKLKPFLMPPMTSPQGYSQFTYDEALLIKDRTMQLMQAISKKMHDGTHFPHFLHDQTKLKSLELLEASSRYDEIIITAVSTEVKKAIVRSHARGVATNRFEHTEGLLNSHRAVPTEMINALAQPALLGKKITVSMWDNNDESGHLQQFASIEMATGCITIYDGDLFEKWLKKTLINPKSHDFASLYKAGPMVSIKGYFSPLLALGLTIEYADKPLESKGAAAGITP